MWSKRRRNSDPNAAYASVRTQLRPLRSQVFFNLRRERARGQSVRQWRSRRRRARRTARSGRSSACAACCNGSTVATSPSMPGSARMRAPRLDHLAAADDQEQELLSRHVQGSISAARSAETRTASATTRFPRAATRCSANSRTANQRKSDCRRGYDVGYLGRRRRSRHHRSRARRREKRKHPSRHTARLGCFFFTSVGAARFELTTP